MFSNTSLIDLLRISPTLGVLLLTSVVTLGFAIERFLYFRGTHVNARRFMQEISPKVVTGDFDAATKLCRQHKGARRGSSSRPSCIATCRAPI